MVSSVPESRERPCSFARYFLQSDTVSPSCMQAHALDRTMQNRQFYFKHFGFTFSCRYSWPMTPSTPSVNPYYGTAERARLNASRPLDSRFNPRALQSSVDNIKSYVNYPSLYMVLHYLEVKEVLLNDELSANMTAVHR